MKKGDRVLKKYTIEKQLVKDRFFEIFIAYKGPVAFDIYVLNPKLVSVEASITRLNTIAETFINAESQYVQKMIEYGTYKKSVVLVYAHIVGDSVQKAMPRIGFPIKTALNIADRTAKCLGELVKTGIPHVNLNSNHIILEAEGGLKVTGWGAAAAAQLCHLIENNEIPRVDSDAPELSMNIAPSVQADIYSLGVILYWMVTGTSLKTIVGGEELRTRQNEWPSKLKPGVPPELDELIINCVTQNKDERIQNVEEFIDGVTNVYHGLEIGENQTIVGGGGRDSRDSLIGKTIGSFRIKEKIGKGGMAEVYKAYDPALDRYIALKILPKHLVNEKNFLARFRREARSIAKLDHPIIIPIYKFGEEDGQIYIAMRLVEEGTLKDIIGTPLELRRAVLLTVKIAKALKYAHSKGVVHRDIKPSNILLAENDWPLITDFGLARMISGEDQITRAGSGVGTPAYMSPEQGRGGDVDARSDIYSLGIVLFEMLTGEVPFKSESHTSTIIKHIIEPLPDPKKFNKKIPNSVVNVIYRATAKDPKDRYQNAGELLIDLGNVLDGSTVRKVSKSVRKFRSGTRNIPGWVWVAAGAVILGFFGFLSRDYFIKTFSSISEPPKLEALPREVTAILSNAKIVFVDGFDKEDDFNYKLINGKINKGQLNLHTIGVPPLGIFKELETWEEDGHAALVTFLFDEKADFSIGFQQGDRETDNWRIWGIGNQDKVIYHIGGNVREYPLTGTLNMEPGRWYYGLFVFIENDKHLIRVWDAENPMWVAEKYSQYSEDTSEFEWHSYFMVIKSKLYIGEYYKITFEELLPNIIPEKISLDTN